MSSYLLQNLENSTHFLNLADSSSQQKDYKKSLILLKFALQKNPDHPSILFSLSKTCHLWEDDLEALKWNDKALEILEKFPNNVLNESLKMNAYALRLEILEKTTGMIQKIQDTLGKFEDELSKSEFMSPEVKNSLFEKIQLQKHRLSATQNFTKYFSLHDRKAQASTIYDMIKATEDLSVYYRSNRPLYILSMKWFKKWKKYTYFHHLTGDHTEKKEEVTNNNNEIIDALTSDEEEDQEELTHAHPGNIDQDDILEEENDDVLLDPEEKSNYTNEILKKGLEENKDYIIVSEKVWKYLNGFYQGREIRRFVMNVNDKDYFLLELWLKKIKFVVWPNLGNINSQELKLQTIYISKRDSIKSLKEKIQRIFATHPMGKMLQNKEIRVWKNFDYESFLSKKYKFDDRHQISLKSSVLLDDQSNLEEAEINEEDTILIEIKFFSMWAFTLEKTIPLVKGDLKTCNFCKKSKPGLLNCVCSQVFYCDQICQKGDWKNHAESCRKARAEQQKPQISNSVQIKDPDQLFSKSSKRGLAGLQNIGNTCFMNSGLQCLSNVYMLTKYFLSKAYLSEINEKNVLGTGGRLAKSYANLLEEVWVDDKPHASTWEIKKIIAKLAPQFYGYNQQDSQEFLSYLLDGLHEDLNRVKDKPFVENKDIENCDDELVSQEMWQNYLKRNKSIIIDYFAGQYKSTLVCPDCNRVSITFDPFLIASLPIPAMDYTQITVFFIFRDSKRTPKKLKVNLFSFITVETLIHRISKYLEVDEQFVEMCWVKDHLIGEFVNRHTIIKKFKDCDGIIFMYEKFKPQPQIPYSENNFVKAEVQIFHKSSKKPDASCKTVGYTRLFLANLNLTLAQIHLEIYKILRPNIRTLYANASEWSNFHSFFNKYDFRSNEEEAKDPSLINLDLEYKEIFLPEKKDLFAPYSLYIMTKKGDKKISFDQVPFNHHVLRTLLKECLVPEHLKFQIRFEYCVKPEVLKLSLCIADNDHKDINDTIKKSFTIQECFELFTREEKLDKDNEWYCSKCKAHKQATKKMELFKLPQILILHLKRFKTSRIGSIGSLYFPAGSTKINSFVEFPVEHFDMKPFCKKKDENGRYELIGVSNHFGEMNGGHYTAYCKNHFTGTWFEFDDTRVSKCRDGKEMVSEAAYMLFYKKVE